MTFPHRLGCMARHRMGIVKICFTAVAPLIFVSSLFAQDRIEQFGTQHYESAYVRVARNGGEPNDIRMLSDRIRITNATAKHLIEWAYQVKDYQLGGSPDWIDTERYDLDVTESPSSTRALQSSTGKQWMEYRRAEIRAILADRFQLKVQQQTPDSPMYVITSAGSEPKLHPNMDIVSFHSDAILKDGVLTLDHASIADFADTLSEKLGSPIIDESGLRGSYDLEFQLPRDPVSGNPPPDIRNSNSPESSVVAAIQSAMVEQLGLRLERRISPVKQLSILSVERPTLN